MLERYGHGGDLHTAAEQFGLQEEDFLDFSSNMNPLGPPEYVAEVIQQTCSQIVHYPDPVSRQLKNKIAEIYNVPIEAICVGNGAAELIDLIVKVWKPQRTALLRPSFTEYEEAVLKAGGHIVDVVLHEENGYRVQQDDLLNVWEEADAFFIGHPNNPTGQLLPEGLLDELFENQMKYWMIDEAFIDFVDDEEERSFIRQAVHMPNVAVIRSMTKFYSIPGVRLGFMVAHPSVIQKMETLKVPWSVNVFAQKIGEAVLGDADYARRTKKWLQVEKRWLSEALTSIGIHVYPSDVNFLLAALPVRWTAARLQQEMGRRGILIRDASLFSGLQKHHCRFAVKTREQNEQLVAELTSVLHGNDGY